MKRIIKVLSIVIVCFLLCGCSKKLTCVKMNTKEKNEIILKFSKDTPRSLKFIKTYTYGREDPYIDMKYLEVKEEYGIFDNIKGAEYKIKKDYNVLTITLDINYKEYENNVNYKLPVIKDDLINNKHYLVANNYACK